MFFVLLLKATSQSCNYLKAEATLIPESSLIFPSKTFFPQSHTYQFTSVYSKIRHFDVVSIMHFQTHGSTFSLLTVVDSIFWLVLDVSLFFSGEIDRLFSSQCVVIRALIPKIVKQSFRKSSSCLLRSENRF